MANYGEFCPVARTLEVLGDRWTPLIIRNMLCGMTHFNDLERSLPRISRSLLARRMRLLQQAGVIEKQINNAGRNTTEYHLTQAGQELQNIIAGMMIWGERWASGEPSPEQLDPILLMWSMRSDVQKNRLPEKRVVVQYDFHLDQQRGSFWLVLTTVDVSVCVTDPGYEIDLLVTADLAAFYQLWYGRITYREAIRDYAITVEGLPHLVRAFPDWFAWGAAAEGHAARTARQLQPATA